MTDRAIDWQQYSAVLFDLDGVVTSTARVHAAAWKQAFDEFLSVVAPDQPPFDPDAEYRAHVDGLPRYDGVAGFLAARGLELPRGEPSDAPGLDTVCALGNLKNAAFGRHLTEHGAEVFPDALDLLDHLETCGVPVAVVSSSANCETILESAGLADRFDGRVDGVVARSLGLVGKPAPDTFVEGARRLGAAPADSVVIEDAVSGVQAAAAGPFALAIGVARDDDGHALRQAGADIVVSDLAALVPDPAWPDHPFVAEPWGLTRLGVSPEGVGLDETLFSLGNGNLGVRAAFAQGAPIHKPGVLLNGLHETWPIVYPEPAYGYASLGQTILYLPDATLLAVEWDGRRLDLDDARVSRHLDFRTGIVTTTARWPELTARWERLVSLRHDDVLAQRLTVEATEAGDVAIRGGIVNRFDEGRSGGDVKLFPPGSDIDPRLAPGFRRRVIESSGTRADGPSCVLGFRTSSSDLPLSVAARAESSLGSPSWIVVDGDRAELEVAAQVAPGVRHTVESVAAYRRDDDLDAAGSYLEGLDRFDALAAAQAEELDAFWEASDIEIGGDRVAQQAVRYAMLQLHWATASLRGRGVPARGLTGRTYEGHHFWDSDVFVVPFLAATNPAAARQVIEYRSGMLPQARARARQLSVDGALFPWRTITGEEASAFFEASTAQYHIDADVVYGLRRYVEWTGDDETLWDLGAEIAVETARMWASVGFFDDDGYHIHKVTGPDEYTALVDDNAYTNQMARMNLRYAAAVLDRMRHEQPDRFDRLATRLALDQDEEAEWARIADALIVLRDDEIGVTAQDATFLSLEPWDWDTPRDKYPLLRHFHPLVIYRHQVLKQADTVMGHFLLPGDTPVEQQRADFDFYDPLTTGDSSLSPAIQAAVAARVGRDAAAWDHFRRAAELDLTDDTGSTVNGIHLACAAGIWLAVVHGFAGVELTDGDLKTEARLPEGWTSLTINLEVRGQRQRVVVESSRRDDGD